MQRFVGQQTHLKQYSKLYWQPMEGKCSEKLQVNGGDFVTTRAS